TPDQGRIACGDDTFVGRDARVDLLAERRNLGIVFQSYAIWPHMTVAQNVAFPLRVRRMSKPAIRARVTEVLALVELSALADRYPHQLSGGQQQRVALARAIASSPTVLLLDEALSMSDRILVMNGGRILREGTPEEVYRQPRVRFVAEFLGQCNFLTGAI